MAQPAFKTREKVLRGTEWIPCAERMPPLGESVLVASENGEITVVRIPKDRHLLGPAAKHWMPLPEPPK